MFEQRERVVNCGRQCMARARQRAAIRVPNEQFDAERLFEPLDLAGDSRLRKTEFASGGRKTAVACSGVEDSEALEPVDRGDEWSRTKCHNV